MTHDSDPFSPQESSYFLISFPSKCVHPWSLYCSTPWIKVLVIPKFPLIVKWWGFLQGTFLLYLLYSAANVAAEYSRGKHREKKRTWPLLKKIDPLIWFLVSLGLPMVSSLAACAGGDSGSPLLNVVMSYLVWVRAGKPWRLTCWLILGLAVEYKTSA